MLQLAVFVCDDVPKVVLGDPWRFRQILTNLVGNAVKVSSQFWHPHATTSNDVG